MPPEGGFHYGDGTAGLPEVGERTLGRQATALPPYALKRVEVVAVLPPDHESQSLVHHGGRGITGFAKRGEEHQGLNPVAGLRLGDPGIAALFRRVFPPGWDGRLAGAPEKDDGQQGERRPVQRRPPETR